MESVSKAVEMTGESSWLTDGRCPLSHCARTNACLCLFEAVDDAYCCALVHVDAPRCKLQTRRRASLAGSVVTLQEAFVFIRLYALMSVDYGRIHTLPGQRVNILCTSSNSFKVHTWSDDDDDDTR